MAKDLKEIISTIELTEEQGSAITGYLAEYLNTWKEKIEEKIRSEAAKSLTEEYNKKAKDFKEQLKKALTEEIEGRLTKELSEKISSDKQAEMDKKLQEALDVANDYYASKFAMFVQEAIKEVEKTMSEEKTSSPEVRTFREIVGAIQPFVESVDNSKLIEILESQDKVINSLNAKYEALNKEKTIAECLAETPDAHKESMRRFLEEAATAEEVASKFETAYELIKNTKEIFEGKHDDESEINLDFVNEGKKPKGTDSNDDDSDDNLDDLNLDEDDEINEEDDDDFFEDDDDDLHESKSSKIEEDYFADKLETKTAAPLNEGKGDEDEGDAKLQSKRPQSRLEYLIGSELMGEKS